MATKIKNTIENIKPVNSLPIIFKNHLLHITLRSVAARVCNDLRFIRDRMNFVKSCKMALTWLSAEVPGSAPQARRHIMPHAIGTRLSRLRMEKRYARCRYDQEFQLLVVQ
jgi:hypothetical protein